jgi:hypothetical protein
VTAALGADLGERGIESVDSEEPSLYVMHT